MLLSSTQCLNLPNQKLPIIMNKENKIHQINFNKKSDVFDYMDEDIAILLNIGKASNFDIVRFNNLVILFCTEGDIELSVNSIDLHIGASDILVCRPFSIVEQKRRSDNFQGKVISLSTHILKNFVHTGKDTLEKAFYINQNPVIHIDGSILDLVKSYDQFAHVHLALKERPYRKEVMRGLMQALIHELLADIERQVPLKPDNQLRQGDILFGKFIRMLSGKIIKERSVSFYSKELCVTSKYLSTVCKQISGKTALEWISEYVMDNICYYLRYTDMSIKEISDLMEFPNLSFFGKYFKAHSGVSPKQYRKNLSRQ